MKQIINLINVPFHLGGNISATNLAPAAICDAGVIERLSQLGFSIESTYVDSSTELIKSKQNHNNFFIVKEINEKLEQTVRTATLEKKFPLVLGGDHSIAIGTIAGVSTPNTRSGIIWFDAHADLNTGESSISKNIHGMSLAVNLGYGDQDMINIGGFSPKILPEDIVMIGIRDLDVAERMMLKDLKIKVYTISDIDRLGILNIMKETIDYFENRSLVHLSFDFDVLDPLQFKDVSTSRNRGITIREAFTSLEMLSESQILTSAEFVEFSPSDTDDNFGACIVSDLIVTLFGETIL